MADRYVSAYAAEVRVYGTFADVPSGVVGTDPLDPPDSTYLWPTNQFLAVGGGETQIGVAYFDQIDVTTNGSPRLRFRMAGTATGGGFQAEPVIEFYPRADPFNESALIGSYVFPYPQSWYTSGGPVGSYAMGSTQEIEYAIPTAVQTALAADGVAAWIFVNGSSTGDGVIGMQVMEFRLALTAPANPPPLRRYPPVNNGGFGPTRHYPRSPGRRVGKSY